MDDHLQGSTRASEFLETVAWHTLAGTLDPPQHKQHQAIGDPTGRTYAQHDPTMNASRCPRTNAMNCCEHIQVLIVCGEPSRRFHEEHMTMGSTKCETPAWPTCIGAAAYAADPAGGI